MRISVIAQKLCRNRSTIYREVKRNSDGKFYLPHYAQQQYVKRRCRQASKIKAIPSLYHYILSRLKRGWSPEQIAGVLRCSNKPFTVCHETIYRYIYGQNKKNWYQYLHYGKPCQGKRNGRKHGSRKFKKLKLIHTRPKEADERQFGHWEGDTIRFSSSPNKINIGTYVERKTRYVHLLKNENLKSSVVLGAIAKVIESEPKKVWKTLTVDQGSEFANYRSVERATSCQVYFCDPHSPWQKGSNENMNGRLSAYLPRSTDIESITQMQLDLIAKKLNNTPRKCLGYLSPKQALLKECKSYCRTSG